MIVYDIEHLSKSYPNNPKLANDDITLEIYQGEIFGILGDNGAGKTTLLRQMVNLVRRTKGSIKLFGVDVESDPLWVPLRVGYMPQEGRALNVLTVEEAIFYTAHLRGMNRRRARQECKRLLELWQIEDLSKRYAIQLSGGQQRLLNLAVALAGQPPILILDEPTNDLDPQRRRLVWDTLRHINAEHGITIIFITHDAIEAEKIIQRVGIMHEGRLVVVGRPAELKRLVDRKMRLEMRVAPHMTIDLPVSIPFHKRDASTWIAYVDLDQIGSLLPYLDNDKLDDFRLYSVTLEDIYFHYATYSPQEATALSAVD